MRESLPACTRRIHMGKASSEDDITTELSPMAAGGRVHPLSQMLLLCAPSYVSGRRADCTLRVAWIFCSGCCGDDL